MIMALTILLGMTSSNFLTIWFSMEMNLIVFVPLMVGTKTISEEESTIKYYLIQSISSSMFLLSSISILHLNSSVNFFSTLMTISILTKLGAAPLHQWFPTVLKNISWENVFLTAVLQKIIPFFIIMTMSIPNSCLVLVVLLNALIGSLKGFTQLCLKKIMAYSSISHMSWLLMAIKTNLSIFIFYFIFYLFLMLQITIFFKNMSLNYLSDIPTKIESSSISILMSMNMLSLAGVPPFLGFYPKIATMNMMMKEKVLWLPIFMMTIGIMSTYIYTRVIFSYMMIFVSSLKNIKGYSLKKTSWFFLICTEMTIMMLTFFLFLAWIP